MGHGIGAADKSIEEILDDTFETWDHNDTEAYAKLSKDGLRMHHGDYGLPISYRRTDIPGLRLPARDIEDFLSQDLKLDSLQKIFPFLWLAGRPMPPRPLHYQRYLQRDIVIVHKMDMHLVWAEKRLFLTPLPRYLLSSAFWRIHMNCRENCNCRPALISGPQDPADFCQQQNFRRIAAGFLYSYAGLIVNEYDFRMARDAMLLPKELTWPSLQTLLRGLLNQTSLNDKIDRRFIFGELRQGRLNKIRYCHGSFRSYQSNYPTYTAFWRENLSWLAIIIGYVLLVLTAMQVGLATNFLMSNDAFQSVSVVFTALAILGPIGLLSILLAGYLGKLSH